MGLGAGNGMNFRHCPASIEEVVALVPELYLRAKAQEAALDAPVRVSVLNGVTDALPFEDASPDATLRLLRAPRGLLDDDNPLIPGAVLDAFATAHPGAVVEEVAGVNHYMITLGAGAATVAAAIAAAVDHAMAAA